MKKVILSESQLKYIVNAVNENQFDETRTEIDNGNIVEIDNFDEIENLIDIQSPDDVYYLQLIKRRKDNPSLRLVKDEYVKYYLIHSYDELLKLKPEIKYFCIINNARAYLTANRRSETNCKHWADVYMKDNRSNFRGKYAFVRGHETEYAFGRSFEDDIKRDVVMIDIDTPDKSVHDKVRQILKKYKVDILMEYPSLNNGLHIFTKSQEQILDAYLAKEFLQFDGGQDLGRLSTVGVDFDKNALLYACLKPQGYRSNYSAKTTAICKNGAKAMRDKLQRRSDELKSKV